jgi:hypothetical protein
MGCNSSRHAPVNRNDDQRFTDERRRHPRSAVILTRQQGFRNSTERNSRNNLYEHPAHHRGIDTFDLSALTRPTNPDDQRDGGGEEIRRLQLDLETLEILFQRLLGQSFTEQIVRNMEAANLFDPSNDPSVMPPAATTVIENLTCIECLSEEDLINECNRECCICFFQHNVGDSGVARLPCGHLFHRKCIVEWLEKKCSCPICRYEVPSDNQAYESGRIERMKARKLRIQSHELGRMSISELQSIAETPDINDRSELVKVLRNSDRVDILEAPPQAASNGGFEEEKEEVESNMALVAAPSNSSSREYASNN